MSGTTPTEGSTPTARRSPETTGVARFPDWVWAVGEESSDPLVHVDGPDGRRRTTRVDQLGASGHLDHVSADCRSVAAVGATTLRYGIPWQRTEVADGVYDWSLWDRSLAAIAEAGLDVVVDLCHFGLPDHLCGHGSEHAGFTDPAWVDAFLRYVEAFLRRYPEPRCFTPVNEPTTTAFCSAMWGAWNDGVSSVEDYGRALVLCETADALAAAAIRADRPACFPGAEALAIPARVHPDREDEAHRQVAQWFAALDLRTGHPLDPLAEPLLAAVPDGWLDRLGQVADPTGIVAGHDLYPVSVQPFDAPGEGGEGLDVHERVRVWSDFARRCHDRYGLPIWVAETSNLGLDPDLAPVWLDAVAGAAAELRADGVDVRGICWYSRGDQVDWDHALVPPAGIPTLVGLYDAERRPRPAAKAFRRLATAGAPRAAADADG